MSFFPSEQLIAVKAAGNWDDLPCHTHHQHVVHVSLFFSANLISDELNGRIQQKRAEQVEHR